MLNDKMFRVVTAYTHESEIEWEVWWREQFCDATKLTDATLSVHLPSTISSPLSDPPHQFHMLWYSGFQLKDDDVLCVSDATSTSCPLRSSSGKDEYQTTFVGPEDSRPSSLQLDSTSLT